MTRSSPPTKNAVFEVEAYSRPTRSPSGVAIRSEAKTIEEAAEIFARDFFEFHSERRCATNVRIQLRKTASTATTSSSSSHDDPAIEYVNNTTTAASKGNGMGESASKAYIAVIGDDGAVTLKECSPFFVPTSSSLASPTGGLLKYETENFLVRYPRYDSRPTSALCELYLFHLYSVFKAEFVHLLQTHDVFPLHTEEITRADRAAEVENFSIIAFTVDVISHFALRNYSTEDIPFFLKNAEYKLDDVSDMLGCRGWSKGRLDRFRGVLQVMSSRSRECYQLYKLREADLLRTPYSIRRTVLTHVVSLSLTLQPSESLTDDASTSTTAAFPELRAKEHTLYVKKSIYAHLVKMYNLANFDEHSRSSPVDERDFVDNTFALYYRYYAFDNGDNQSSILPGLKLALKKEFNIKVEMFGSAINTSNRFGSLFYDVERNFGSFGNFFNVDIKKGFFEVNPPYENSLMNDVFCRMGKWLREAQGAMLFFVVLPKRNYKTEFECYREIAPFEKVYVNVPKDRFPFMRYDRQLFSSRISPIVDVVIIILHNDRVSNQMRSSVARWRNGPPPQMQVPPSMHGRGP